MTIPSNSRFVSIREMMDAGKEIELGNHDPVTETDYIKLVNFFAVNIHPAVMGEATKLAVQILRFPLEESLVAEIIEYQFQEKVKQGYCPKCQLFVCTCKGDKVNG